MQLYSGTRVMATDVDTLSMAAYSAARRGRQSSKVGRLWHCTIRSEVLPSVLLVTQTIEYLHVYVSPANDRTGRTL